MNRKKEKGIYRPHKGKVNRHFEQEMEFKLNLTDKEDSWESFRSGDWDDKALFKENCPNSSTGLKIRTERDRHQGNELGNYCHSSALMG